MYRIVNFIIRQNRIVPDSKCAIRPESEPKPEPDSTKVASQA